LLRRFVPRNDEQLIIPKRNARRCPRRYSPCQA